MDKELTIQDLEAQADALLAAADEMEELLPADTGKSKRKKAEDEAPEKKAPPLDEKVLAGLPAAEQLQKSEKLRDLFAKGKQKGKLDSDEITEVLDELDLDDDGLARRSRRRLHQRRHRAGRSGRAAAGGHRRDRGGGAGRPQ